jgi:hypothetical protein
MLPNTATRVPEHTAEDVNNAIDRETAAGFGRRVGAGAQSIQKGLDELEREWDVERTLQTNFAVVTLAGLVLGALVDRRWYLFSAAAAGFMVQHALQGWCPPISVFRRLGFRTESEINHERYALKVARGDFARVASTAAAPERAARAWTAARR